MCLTAQLVTARPLQQVALRDLRSAHPNSSTILSRRASDRSISEVPAMGSAEAGSIEAEAVGREEAAQETLATAGGAAAAAEERLPSVAEGAGATTKLLAATCGGAEEG